MASLLKKGTKTYSIIHLKCPRCQQGNLFTEHNAFKVNTMLNMPNKCPVCNQNFVFESGFYSAALWTSYPIVIFVAILNVLIFFVGLHITGAWLLIITGVILIACQPYIMRLGRAILINNFVDYNPNYKQKQ